MAKKRTHILVVDDTRDGRELLKDILVTQGYVVEMAASGQEGLDRVGRGGIDLVLLDLVMPGMDGLETLQRLKETPAGRDTLVVMLTAYANADTAVEAMKLGAHDYVTRPTGDVDELRRKVCRAVSALQLTRKKPARPRKGKGRRRVPKMVSQCPCMLKVFDMMEKVAPTEATVLILGESGVGKELVARAIHEGSTRAGGPFVPVNCAAIPKNLMEAELFGHERGAFTGAIRAKPGAFELADGGTIFLDEIAELTPDSQTKLFRVLEYPEFVRVGGTETRNVDVRVIAATYRDLPKAVAEGRFDRALLYRLDVFGIRVPPLRERKTDIPLLAQDILEEKNGEMKKGVRTISPAAMAKLEGYDYPGNVRELANAIERAVILADGDVLTPEVISIGVSGEVSADLPTHFTACPFAEAKARFEKAYTETKLRETGGVIQRAARNAAMDRKNFKKKMVNYGIAASDFK